MHYIIGTQFSKSGKQLLLHNIVTKDDKLVYTFREATGDKFDIEFDDTLQADKYIANAKRERLPDYESFYKSNRG